ncbi:insulinase family protein [Candidatus Dependentiae bacterium]|nr:insulinase family protein [Candidatus Dependentiae bacterium]MCC7415152.1 insulinase family protein [Campylobacterota bacterium]
MQKNLKISLGLTLCFLASHPCQGACDTKELPSTIGSESAMQSPVHKKILSNGLTVLVRPVSTVPKVSLQLWYDVGAKDEKTGEKGLAHLIEHMIFKGTEGEGSLNLSESDINTVTHKLSGSCNAFTWYDYTGYLFNLPVHTWQEALPIMADCMINCSFKEEHLSSEMKAVIQELKMRNDKYSLCAAEALMTSIYADHPYHYPVIGYKQDLWNAHADMLRDFYRKHYCPNNATLVIVGDVDVNQAFKVVEEYFGSIPANPDYAPETFNVSHDIVSKSVTLYRDVQQPTVMLAFVVPGATQKLSNALEVAALALGSGKGSRLYKKIVDDLQLATSLEVSTWDLFDSGLFMVAFEPKRLEDVDTIAQYVTAEITAIAKNGLTPLELTRAAKKVRMNHYSLLESTESQAYEIGKAFLATGDENYVFTSVEEPLDELHTKLREVFKKYCRPSVMHRAMVLPLDSKDKPYWSELQKESDAQDNRILSARIRTEPVEPPVYANSIKPGKPGVFDYPKPTVSQLNNGIKLLSYNNPATAKIDLTLELKAKSFYEPEDQQGIYNFVASLLTEGTEKHTAAQLAQELESRGMSLHVSPGSISMSMLSDDLPKGLELLMEVLTKATFVPSEIEKVRQQILTEIKNFWDSPSSCSGQIIRQSIYKDHPYSKNGIGVAEVVASLTREQLMDFYKNYISPDGAKLAIVGDIAHHNLGNLLNKTIGAWKGPKVETIKFPAVKECATAEVVHPMERDQVVLCFARPSIDRKHPDFDKLSIFDQILGGGVLNSMSSRLFELREQSGLFYSINGTTVANANEQPGMLLVKTLVSLDRLAEAEKRIKETVRTAADTITPDELAEAKNAITNSLVLNFESNEGIANAFLFVDRYGFPLDYFDTRAKRLEGITIADVQAAVQPLLRAKDLMVFKIGRVQPCEPAQDNIDLKQDIN